MNPTFDIWKLMAGIGVFLFGMVLLEESVKALSGKVFRRLIRHYTDGRLKSICSGTLVTAILQSSAAVSLMVLAFVGAGVMQMENAIGVIMGANIGTTFTAWIVATLGFKLKIESFAFPLLGFGGLGLVLFSSTRKLFQSSRLLIGFGFLFLGLNYMRESVEVFTQSFDLNLIPDYGIWLYVAVGLLLTALMQSSSASIAIVLTALNTHLITFTIGVAMVIGANVGSTIIIVISALGGSQAKKRVAMSHLTFNLITATVAFTGIPYFVAIIRLFIDIEANSVMGLALFHTLFNVMGVIVVLPFIGLLARLLIRIYPEHKAHLAVYIHNTPAEVVEAATDALRNEIIHLLVECQLYSVRILKIEETIVFEEPTLFERGNKKDFSVDTLYENIKILHGEIFSFYSKVQSQKLEEGEVHELERMIYASRNIMNSIKNIKGIRHDLDEFDASENPYLNNQYALFRKRMVELLLEMGRTKQLETQEEQYAKLLETFVRFENLDHRFVQETMAAAAAKEIQEIEISSLLLVNRLFTQSCRLQVFGLKDLLLTQEQINNFDQALDMKTIVDNENTKSKHESYKAANEQ